MKFITYLAFIGAAVEAKKHHPIKKQLSMFAGGADGYEDLEHDIKMKGEK